MIYSEMLIPGKLLIPNFNEYDEYLYDDLKTAH